MRWLTWFAAGLALTAGLLTAAPAAQPVFRGDEIFPPEEYAARRTAVGSRY